MLLLLLLVLLAKSCSPTTTQESESEEEEGPLHPQPPNQHQEHHQEARVVSIKYGRLRGLVMLPAGSKSLPPIEAYLGVPYATPPKGSLRFMPPVTPPPWSGIRTADRFGPVCPQRVPDAVLATVASHNPNTNNNNNNSSMPENGEAGATRVPKARLEFLKRIVPSLMNQSEDCLNLNIYAPAKAASEGLRLPVMVYIHGESFEWNSGNPYDGSVLASFADVVVVTLNYRLGVFGFLSTESDKVRGNYGLLDQVAALHWIQENIVEFGGDPKNVTLFGHDYGAACVNFLMISPVTKGLFQRVILQSGSALAHWALVREPLKYARQLSAALECPIRSTHEGDDIVKCLRSMPVEDILEVGIRAPEHLTAFGPTIDGTVIPNDPEKLMQAEASAAAAAASSSTDFSSHLGNGSPHSHPFDLLFGVTSTEGSFPFTQDEFLRGFEADKRERLTRTFVRNLYSYHTNEILAVLSNEYTDWTKPAQHPINTRDSTMEMLGDAQYVAPLVHAATLHSMAGANAYFYVFDYQPKDADYPQRLGCFHGEELPFIFGGPLVEGLGFFNKNYTRTERAMAEAVIRLWTNFAKTGDPNDPEKQNVAHNNNNRNKNRFARVVWPQFEHVHQKYLSIDTRPKVRHHYRAHKLSVWLRLIPEIHRAGAGTSSLQHHLLDRHDDPETFEGRVRPLPYPWPSPPASGRGIPTAQSLPGAARADTATTRTPGSASTGGPSLAAAAGPDTRPLPARGPEGNVEGPRAVNGTDSLRVETVQQPGSYSTALSVTIAVGCSLLILNVLIFAGVYYQRDKNRVQAGLHDRAAYQTTSKTTIVKDVQGGAGGAGLGTGNMMIPSQGTMYGMDEQLHHPPLPATHPLHHMHQHHHHHHAQHLVAPTGLVIAPQPPLPPVTNTTTTQQPPLPPPRAPPPSPISKGRHLQEYGVNDLPTSQGVAIIATSPPRKMDINASNAPEAQPLLLQNTPSAWPPPRKPNMQEVGV